LIGSLDYPNQNLGVRVTNNIIAGSIFVGFATNGHDCNIPNPQVFRDNIAHSISGGSSGAGALIFPDPSKPEHKICWEVSRFAAYKCEGPGIWSMYYSKRA